MSRRFIDLALVAGIAFCLGLTWMAERDTSVPGLEFMPEMVHSPAFASFSANPHFADGRTLRKPVEGTIARGHKPLHFKATPEDAVRAGRELEMPPAIGRSDDGQGRAVYENFCTPCHGAGGLGDGPVIRRGVPAPPSLLAENARAMPDGRIFHVLSYGQGNMPSYAAQLSQEERWQVIRYIRSLQGSEETR